MTNDYACPQQQGRFQPGSRNRTFLHAFRRRSVCLGAAFLVCAVGTFGVYAEEEATLLATNAGHGFFPNCNADAPGIVLSHFPSGNSKRVYSETVGTVVFSPDGKRIAFTKENELYIMNNDGSDIRETGITEVGCNTCSYGFSRTFKWTTNGMFWGNDGQIFRYLPGNDTATVVATLTDKLTECNPSRYLLCDKGEYRCCDTETQGLFDAWCSGDGRKWWILDAYDANIEGYRCCSAGGRGAKPFIVFNDDFTDWKVMGYGTPWGHGQGMTIDGWTVMIRMAEHRHWQHVVWFDENTAPHVVYGGYGDANPYQFTGGADALYPALDPPIPEGIEAGFNFPRCVNNDSIALAPAKNGKNYLYRWKTHPPELIGVFPTCDGFAAEFWYGPLPDPHDGIPYLSASRKKLTFVLPPGRDSETQSLTVKNLSAGPPMTRISVTTTPATAENWLETSVAGNGGNAQEVTVTALSANLPGDVGEAVITIGGGGASNTVNCAVTAYRGEALAPPTGLEVAAAGDSLLDAALTWTDNAGNETGYLVQRQTNDNPWEEIARTPSDATTFTDSGLDYQTTYTYRIRAFKTLDNGVQQETGSSNEADVTIKGIPWIRVHAPSEGAYIRAGEEYTIRWSANLVGQVRVFLSTDGGKNPVDIHPGGGISLTSKEWDNFSYRMPESESDQALIMVQKYEGDVEGYSGLFHISSTIFGKALPAGYLKDLLQLEKADNGSGKGPHHLAAGDAAAVEQRYVGTTPSFPCTGEAFTEQTESYTWKVRGDSDGVWADEDVDDFVSYWGITLFAPEQQTVRLGYRNDDAISVWNNGVEWFSEQSWDGGSEQQSNTLKLQTGYNHLLFKLRESAGGNRFAVRLLDEEGDDATGLFYSLESCQSQDTRHSRPVPAPGNDGRIALTSLSGGQTAIAIGADSHYTLRIFSATGRVLWYFRGVSPETIVLPEEKIRSGIYVLDGTIGTQRVTRRFVRR